MPLDRGEQRGNPGQVLLDILRAEMSRGLSEGMEIFEPSLSLSLGGYRSLRLELGGLRAKRKYSGSVESVEVSRMPNPSQMAIT